MTLLQSQLYSLLIQYSLTEADFKSFKYFKYVHDKLNWKVIHILYFVIILIFCILQFESGNVIRYF